MSCHVGQCHKSVLHERVLHERVHSLREHLSVARQAMHTIDVKVNVLLILARIDEPVIDSLVQFVKMHDVSMHVIGRIGRIGRATHDNDIIPFGKCSSSSTC